MRDQLFSTPEEAVDIFKIYVEIPQSKFKSASKIGSNIKKCIDLNGECFEKQ